MGGYVLLARKRSSERMAIEFRSRTEKYMRGPKPNRLSIVRVV